MERFGKFIVDNGVMTRDDPREATYLPQINREQVYQELLVDFGSEETTISLDNFMRLWDSTYPHVRVSTTYIIGHTHNELDYLPVGHTHADMDRQFASLRYHGDHKQV